MHPIHYISLIALTIILEARGQPAMGKELVAHAVVNRMEISGWSTEEVIFQPHQYLPWERDVLAPGYELRRRWLICQAMELFPRDPWCMEPLMTIGSEKYWDEVYGIAKAVYLGKPEPPGFEGVTIFDNPIFWPDGEPPWASGKEFLGRVGDHAFYR